MPCFCRALRLDGWFQRILPVDIRLEFFRINRHIEENNESQLFQRKLWKGKGAITLISKTAK
jgi:hypothetical protein